MNLKPWREVAVPHEDVLKGTFQQAEFAADLSRVHAGTATDEYQDPVLFFQRTFITEGMRLLLDSVVKCLAGHGGDPVIQLQTAFGGGKTHTMLAVYHLAKGEALASDLPGIPPILDSARVTEMPRAQVVVLDGHTLAPNMPQQRGRTTVHTLWGELAWQLGKEDAYARIKDADTSGTSPGKEALTQLLAAYAPCVILMDELVAYIRQFEDGKTFSGGTYDSNLSFLQALTEALKAVPTAVLLASLPESDKEAGSQRGINALRTLEHYFARVQALWKPVAAEEAFEIVRRRLFASIPDPQAAATVCRAYADFYVANSADVPHETQESGYFERLMQACRRAARTVFLGSAPTTPNQMVRGIETERVVLGCAQPGQQTGVFKDALRRLSDHLHYLNSANNRFWFDTRPNLRREMEERKRRFQDTDDVVPAIRERLEQGVTTGVFGGIHVFRPSSDVPD